MTNFNPALERHHAPIPRAGSLRRTAVSHLRVIWDSLERIGQRRAARELLLVADRLHASRPDLAADIRAKVREGRSL